MTAAQLRLGAIAGQLSGSPTLPSQARDRVLYKNPDDIARRNSSIMLPLQF
jgi:hypothetical protein